MNQNLNSDDYLEPMGKDEIKAKQKPPNLVVEQDTNLKAQGPGEKKREGSFRRLLGGGGDTPKSPQPILDAAANQQSWQQNKRAIDDRYLAMPVGRSASSIQPSSKPDVIPPAGVARGESVNIPAGASPRRPDSDSKKRKAPAGPATISGNLGMPERPAPVPPSQSSRSSSRSSSQSSTSRPSGPPPTWPASRKARAPRAPPSQAANSQGPQSNGTGDHGGRTNQNPFRQFSEEGENGKLQVEYYNV